MQHSITLGIIVPCYNEEAVLPDSALKLEKLILRLQNQHLLSMDSFIAFVDDGSGDKTWNIIDEHHQRSHVFKGLKLSGNVGHQKALLAGLLEFRNQADCLISIDADLQDDIDVIEEMLKLYAEGYDVIYGVRRDRTTDSTFKRQTAHFFNRLMKAMGVRIVYNHADFRLSSRRVIEALSQYREINLFLRGIYPLIGFRTTEVYYDRKERLAGETKYPLKKMLSFAWDGITSFSVSPLRIVTVTGFIVFLLSLILSFYVIFSYFSGHAIVGWVSTVLPMYFLGGIQLLCIGIIGEYIGKIYKEVKDRPRYFVDEKLG